MTRDQVLEQLAAWGACSDSLEKMRALPTVEAMLAAADVYELEFVALGIGPEFLERYRKAREPATTRYEEVEAPWALFVTSVGRSSSSYDVIARAWMHYSAATAPARKVYNEARASIARQLVAEWVATR